MKFTFDQTERRNEEERTSEERKHTEEVTFLKKTNAQLKVKKNCWSELVSRSFSCFFFLSLNWKELLRQKNKILSFGSKFQFKYYM